MKKSLLISALICIASLSYGQGTRAAFSDVPLSHKHADAINYVESESIVNGYPDGSYKPDQLINRAEFTKIIIAATASEITGSNCFPDVSTQWFAPFICYAKSQNIIGGYPDGTFKPEQNISFAEAAKIIVFGFRYNIPSYEGEWYKPFVTILGDNKAIPTSINAFDKKITRGEMAEMIYRLKAVITNKPSQTFGSLSGETPLADDDPPAVKITSPEPSDDSSKPVPPIPTHDFTFHESNTLVAKINSNPNSEIGMVLKNDQGEGLVVRTKNTGGNILIDELFYLDRAGNHGIIKVNDTGQPERFEYKDHVLTYSNITAQTADITIQYPDGTIQTLESSPLNLPAAVGLDEIRTLLATRRAPLPTITPQADNSDYFIGTTGQVVQMVSCGVGAFLLSPTALVSCGLVISRVVSIHFDMTECGNDYIECYINALGKPTEPILIIHVKDSRNSNPLSNVPIFMTYSTASEYKSGQTDAAGDFVIKDFEKGAFLLSITTMTGYEEAYLDIAHTDGRIVVQDLENDRKLLDTSYDISLQTPVFARFEINLGPPSSEPTDEGGSDEGYDGQWSGQAVDTSGKEGCSNFAISFSVINNELSGPAHDTFEWGGSIDSMDGSMVSGLSKPEATSSSYLFMGNFTETSGTGTWQSQASQGSCSGTFSVNKS